MEANTRFICDFCLRTGPHKCNQTDNRVIHMPTKCHSPDDPWFFDVIGAKTILIDKNKNERSSNKKDPKLPQATKEQLEPIKKGICCKNCFLGECKQEGITLKTTVKGVMFIWHTPADAVLPTRQKLKLLVTARDQFNKRQKGLRYVNTTSDGSPSDRHIKPNFNRKYKQQTDRREEYGLQLAINDDENVETVNGCDTINESDDVDVSNATDGVDKMTVFDEATK